MVNGEAAAPLGGKPGEWATIGREWKSGDTVEVTIPLWSQPAICAPILSTKRRSLSE